MTVEQVIKSGAPSLPALAGGIAQSARGRRLKILGLIFVMFFYLYGVNFTFMPTYTSRVILFFATLYFAASLLMGARFGVTHELRIVAVLYVALLSWVLLGAVLNGAYDTSILVSVWLISAHSFVGGLFLAQLCGKLALDTRQFIFTIQAVIALQAVFIVFYFVSWDFRDWVLAFIPAEGNIDYRENLFQSRGLTHGSGARLSLVQSLGLLFTSYLVATARRGGGQLAYLLLTFALILVSVFLTGRTGLLMLPVVIGYFMLLVLARMRIRRSLLKFIIGIPVAVILIYLSLRLGYQHVLGGFTTASGEDGFDRLVRWVTSEFFSDGRFQSRTAQLLLGHWFVPDRWSVLILGDPATWVVNRIPSDVGFIRLLFGVGIVGLVITYTLFMALFLLSARAAQGLEAKLMLFLLGLFLIGTEVKEPFLIDVNVNAFLLLLFGYFLVVARRCSRGVVATEPATKSS